MDSDLSTCTQRDDDGCAADIDLGRCEACGYVIHDLPLTSDAGHDELCCGSATGCTAKGGFDICVTHDTFERDEDRGFTSIPVILGTDTFGTTDPATEDVTAERLSDGRTVLVSVEDGELLGELDDAFEDEDDELRHICDYDCVRGDGCQTGGLDCIDESCTDPDSPTHRVVHVLTRPSYVTSPWVTRNLDGQQAPKGRGAIG